MAVEVANDHIGVVIIQGIWVIKLELSSWWFVDILMEAAISKIRNSLPFLVSLLDNHYFDITVHK